MKFAVLANPKAKAFRDPAGLEPVYKLTSGRGLLLTPRSLDELDQELASLVPEQPEFLAVAGGDGTVSRFTTAALKAFGPDALPPIAVLHGGTMNTVSKSMGSRGDPAAQLEGVLKGDAQRTRRWPLRLGFPGAEGPGADGDRYGWLFGTGVIPRYIQVYEAAGETSPGQAAATLAKLSAAAFLGGRPDVFSHERVDVFVDGRQLPLKEWLVIAAGGVDDMGLRFRPFARLLSSPGRIGVYATASRPWRFVTDLLPFRLGLEARHSLSFHRTGEELRLVSPEPLLFNLDGDVEVAPSTTLTVRPGPPITFLLPPGSKPPRNALGPDGADEADDPDA
jgi:diacylglycerol kinase family enzyme